MTRPIDADPNSVHQKLYERSLAQQELGKKKRLEVNCTSQLLAAERLCTKMSHSTECDRLVLHDKKTELPCDRIKPHVKKSNETQEFKDEELRTPKPKITLEQANRLYYLGTVASRSRIVPPP